MNRALILFCVIVLSAFFGACAEGAVHRATQIIADQAKGTVTIVIDGEPAVMVDKTGLYVMNGITYGGPLTDVGSHWVKAKIDKGMSGNKAGSGHVSHAE